MNLNIIGLAEQFLGGNAATGNQQIPMSAIIAIMGLIESHPGGLGGLLQQFEAAGLGGHVQSWMGNGANAPISAAQIQQAISPEQLTQLAQKTSLQHPELASMISTYLPLVISHLTPNGTVPQDTAVADGLAQMKTMLGGGAAPATAA